MHEHDFALGPLLWAAGWLVAVTGLFWAALRMPLETRLRRWQGWAYNGMVVVAAIGAAILANAALTLHDAHIDVTREKVYTPSDAAMRVVDELDRPVSVTFFYRSQDPVARRARGVLEVMQRRNPLFKMTSIDPDKEPTLARTFGARIYNAAVVEAEGRRLLVQSIDEGEIAIGVQRVLRQRTIAACFIEGHGELPMDNFEFHTHVEGVTDHSHGEASSQVVEMPGHGAGRLRRALEAQGYETRQLILATSREVPNECSLVIAASPRTTFLPSESVALRSYLRRGGSALLLFDLGFVVEPELGRLVAELGVRLEQQVVIDPLSHYLSDPEMVAVMGYDPHPVTRSISLTFFPGIRPLALVETASGVRATPLLASSRDSYVRTVELAEARVVASSRPPAPATEAPVPGSRILGAASEGTLAGGSGPMRAIVVGDGDFASNSFFAYMSNSDLLLSAVKWLAREERAAMVASRVPVPHLILLTANQARAIFAGVVVLMPLCVVALGFLVWWRRR